jgi:uncharacterized protein (TIGR00251 family)
VRFQVRVAPRAGRSGIDGVREGTVLVRVKAAPVEGAANDELVGIIAAALRVPRRAVTIVSGARGRLKRVYVAGVSVQEAERAFAV